MKTELVILTAALGCVSGLIDTADFITKQDNDPDQNSLSRSEVYLTTVSGGLLGIIASPLYIPYKAYKIIKKLST